MKQGHTSRSCFICGTVKCTFHILFCAMLFFAFLRFLWVTTLFEMAPKFSAEVLSSVLKLKKAMMCLMEKTHVLDMLCSGMNYSDVGHEFRLMKQQYLLSKMSLNKNTH